MFIPRKQSFCTSLDMSFVLLWYTGLYFPMVFLELFSKTMVTLLYGAISVPSSQYCTSLCYHIALLSIIMLYFCPSQYCTFLCYHICIFHHDLFPYFLLTDFIIFLVLHVKVALPNWILVLLAVIVCTSQNHWSYFINFCKWFIIFTIVRGDLTSVLPVVNTCISCSHTCVLPFR
jgi:hypothetical protein